MWGRKNQISVFILAWPVSSFQIHRRQCYCVSRNPPRQPGWQDLCVLLVGVFLFIGCGPWTSPQWPLHQNSCMCPMLAFPWAWLMPSPRSTLPCGHPAQDPSPSLASTLRPSHLEGIALGSVASWHFIYDTSFFKLVVHISAFAPTPEATWGEDLSTSVRATVSPIVPRLLVSVGALNTGVAPPLIHHLSCLHCQWDESPREEDPQDPF